MIRGQSILSDQRMCFAVPQIPRRRTNQFGDLMRVLKLRAVHFDDRAWVPKQYFSGGFHDARLAGTRWTEEQQIAHRPSRRVQSSAEHLIQIHQRLHTLFLADNLGPQGAFKIARVVAADAGIELLANCWSHRSRPLAGRAPQMARRLTKMLQARYCRSETTFNSAGLEKEATPSQQDTKFQFVEPVSRRETVFHPDAK